MERGVSGAAGFFKAEIAVGIVVVFLRRRQGGNGGARKRGGADGIDAVELIVAKGLLAFYEMIAAGLEISIRLPGVALVLDEAGAGMGGLVGIYLIGDGEIIRLGGDALAEGLGEDLAFRVVDAGFPESETCANKLWGGEGKTLTRAHWRSSWTGADGSKVEKEQCPARNWGNYVSVWRWLIC